MKYLPSKFVLLASPRLWELLLLAAFAAFTYLPLVGGFGYYRDDWHVVWGATTEGAASIIKQHSIDRPLMGRVYALVYQGMGLAPLGWNIFAVGLRLLGAAAVWWLANALFQRPRLAQFSALLFLLYPGFLQLPNGHTYQNHLIALAAGLFSLALTFQSLRSPDLRIKVVLLFISAALAALCYFMFEWMIGFEAVRGILLLYILVDQKRPLLSTLKSLLAYWALNLAGFLAYLYWRLRVFQSLRSVTDDRALLNRYLSDPPGMALRFFSDVFKDTWDVAVAAWVQPAYTLLESASPADLFAGAALAAVGILLMLFFWRILKTTPSTPHRLTLLISTLAACLAVSVIPAVLAGREVLLRDGLDRYTLVPALAACLLIAAVLENTGKEWITRAGMLVLIGTAILTHFLNGVYFKEWWEYQRQLWWQLSWRAPQIAEETVLVAALPKGYALAEDYEIWAPANMIYYYGASSLGIYAEALNDQTIWSIRAGGKDERNIRLVYFERNYQNTLVISLPPGGACLRVLGGDAIPSTQDSPLAVLAAPISRPERILTTEKEHIPRTQIFGNPPPVSWCYYYQKASLAAQRGDWQAVHQIDAEAQTKNLRPAAVIEWLPFYHAALRLANQPRAAQLAELLKNDPAILAFCAGKPQTPAYALTLCPTR